LQTWTAGAVRGAVRAAAANMTWREANENVSRFNEEVVRMWKGDMDDMLIRIGLRPSGLRLVIQSVEPSEEVKKALSGVEIARAESHAWAEEVGGTVVRLVDKQIACLSTNLGMTESEVRQYLKDNPSAYNKILADAQDFVRRERVMKGGGELIDIRVGGTRGEGLDDLLSSAVQVFKAIRDSRE
jgi:hypothetical protein